jgi:hypothetical protein
VNVVTGTAQTIVGATTATASCPLNQTIVGGGFTSTSDAVNVFRALITNGGRGGTFSVTADDGVAIGQSVTAIAYCVP